MQGRVGRWLVGSMVCVLVSAGIVPVGPMGAVGTVGAAASTPIGSRVAWAQTNGDILAITKVAGASSDLIAFGGNFTAVITPDGASHPATHFAVVDEFSGELVYAGNANSYVRTISSRDGIIYVGGDFTTFGGFARNRLAALSPTFTVTSWDPVSSSKVRAIVAGAAGIYYGGDGAAVRLVNATTGAGLWSQTLTGGSVRSLALSPGETALYVGGLFETYGTLTRHGLIKANPLTGAPDTAFNANFRADSGVGPGGGYDGEAGNVLQVTPDGNRLLVGVAGQGSDVFKVLNPRTGSVTWLKVLPGDTQAHAIVGTTYIVGYHNKGGSTAPYPYFAAQLESTNSQLTEWDPGLTGFQSNADGGNNGVQAMYADQVYRRLFVAGAFTTENGRPLKSIAVYTWGGPVNRPPVASFTSSASGQTVDFSGAASSDPDGSIASWSWDFGDGTQGTGATVRHSYAAAGTYTVTLRVADNQGASASTSTALTVVATPPDPPPDPPPGPAPATDAFQSLAAPARLLDTRPGETTADGQAQGIGVRGAGSTLTLQVAGRVGIPADAVAVVLNVTVTDPTTAGYATVHTCDGSTPNASNLNYAAGQTIPNMVVAKVGADGSICLFTLAAAHLVVDASGYFPDGTVEPLPAPARLLDTRPGESTVDGISAGIGIREQGSTLTVDVAGRAGIPADAAAVVLNVAVTAPEASGYATVFPCDAAAPTASSLNHSGGQTISNAVVAKIGADGDVCLFTLSRAHYIVDVAAYFPAGTFEPLAAPARLLDTRPGGSTADGQFQGIGQRTAGSSLRLDINGRVGIPDEATAVVLNVTAVLPVGPGYATVFPRGVAIPQASHLNYATGDVISNAVVATIGVDGDVCLFTLAAADYVVDVTGYLTGTPPPSTGTDCPAA